VIVHINKHKDVLSSLFLMKYNIQSYSTFPLPT